VAFLGSRQTPAMSGNRGPAVTGVMDAEWSDARTDPAIRSAAVAGCWTADGQAWLMTVPVMVCRLMVPLKVVEGCSVPTAVILR